MKNTLHFLLKNRIKHSKVTQKTAGFTLIELLVATVISFLVLTPLLGFMVSIMNTDRREQAKARTEQEIQTALNYIARDLQQAVYIYDQTGVNAIKNHIPTGTGKSPILVFWKRQLVTEAVKLDDYNKDDAFVYSLVAYYLINDNNTTWSRASRIGRWQIRDSVRSVNGDVVKAQTPSPGFAPFGPKLATADTIEEGMNSWEKGADAYTDRIIPLIDFVDQTTNSPPTATCPDGLSPIEPADNSTGFYACVDIETTTAQVFIRGNALARLESNPNNINFSEANRTFFPSTNVRVQGRGLLVQ